MSADKAAEVKKENTGSETGIHFIPAVVALTLLVLDAILSVSYYGNQDVYDLRWLLAVLDVAVVLSIYAMFGHRVSRLLVSMKLALTMLFVLAILSIIGTILPQGDQVIKSGWVDNPLYGLYSHLGLFDMYHSRWFLAIMFLLIFNLSVCLYKRLPTTYKRLAKPKVDVRDQYISSQPIAAEIENAGKSSMGTARKILSHHRYHVHEGKSGSVLAEKGRFTGIFSVAFHLSFLFIGIGAILISFLGWEVKLEIPDGTTAAVPNTNLKVTNHRFQLDSEPVYEGERIAGYRPSLYSSDLEVFDGGESVARKTIEVNSPLRYGGVNFHQASYYRTGRGYVTVLSVNKTPGKSLIYIGFFTMMGGIVFTLYFPHRRIWLKRGESGRLLVGGRTNRSKVSFQKDFDQIITELRLSLRREASVDGRTD